MLPSLAGWRRRLAKQMHFMRGKDPNHSRRVGRLAPRAPQCNVFLDSVFGARGATRPTLRE